MTQKVNAGRRWQEKRIAGGQALADGLFVRVAIGEANNAYADFEVLKEQIDTGARGGANPVRRHCIARGFVKADGCVNADLTREDGVMQHWCSAEGVADFGRALVEARRMAGAIIPGLEDGPASTDDAGPLCSKCSTMMVFRGHGWLCPSTTCDAPWTVAAVTKGSKP